MRFLAIDLGARRTGLAVADDRTGVVTPLRVIEEGPGDGLITALRATIKELGPDALVVGLPLNMDGTEGGSAIAARRFAATLTERLALPVHHQDERLTTFAADGLMAQSGRTHAEKKAARDGLAAATMLEDFLRSRRISEHETSDR